MTIQTAAERMADENEMRTAPSLPAPVQTISGPTGCIGVPAG